MIESIESAFEKIGYLMGKHSIEERAGIKSDLKIYFAKFGVDISGDATFEDIPCFPHK